MRCSNSVFFFQIKLIPLITEGDLFIEEALLFMKSKSFAFTEGET